VVDLGRLNPQHWEEEAAAKLRYACEEWGFFQVGASIHYKLET
jgi:isopenicillin N synthase-like dioxygenase